MGVLDRKDHSFWLIGPIWPFFARQTPVRHEKETGRAAGGNHRGARRRPYWLSPRNRPNRPNQPKGDCLPACRHGPNSLCCSLFAKKSRRTGGQLSCKARSAMTPCLPSGCLPFRPPSNPPAPPYHTRREILDHGRPGLGGDRRVADLRQRERCHAVAHCAWRAGSSGQRSMARNSWLIIGEP